MIRTAEAPAKASNSFLLSMGMVNIPLAVLSGTESTRVERKEFLNGDVTKPVGRIAYSKTEFPIKLVENSDIVRMATSSTGVMVALSDDEIVDATMPKGVAEIVAMVPMNKLFGTYLTSKVDQVRPKVSGLNAAQKVAVGHAFSVFLAGLKAAKVAALVKVALRGPATYAAITCDGDLFYLYTADAIRQPAPVSTTPLDPREVEMMTRLIQSYDKASPALFDDTAKAVQTYVDAKAEGGTPTVKTEYEVASGDLLAALTASLPATAKAG